MNLNKTCGCCLKSLTTKDVKKLGTDKKYLWLNCKSCHSTLVIKRKVFNVHSK